MAGKRSEFVKSNSLGGRNQEKKEKMLQHCITFCNRRTAKKRDLGLRKQEVQNPCTSPH